MTPAEFKLYFQHTIGLSLLGIWSKKHNIQIKNNILDIPLLKANLFKIGVPTSIKDKYIFFACERDELNWLKRISWNRIILDPFKRKIVFISNRIEGDKENLPDVTEIALAISYENGKKVSIFNNIKKLSLKEFHIEDEQIILGKENFFELPLVILENEEQKYFNRNELRKYTTHADLLTGNITRTNYFKDNYVGDAVTTFTDSRLNYLTKTFNEKNFEGMVEDPSYFKSTPDDLKEFSQKDYDYEADWIKNRDKNNKKNLEKTNEKILEQWG